MQTDKFNNLIDGIKEKLGEENTSLIADDLAVLISDNAQVNKDIKDKETKINDLENYKDNLIKINGNLLQQVTDDKIEENNFKLNQNNDKKEEPFSFKKQFDKNGDFIE